MMNGYDRDYRYTESNGEPNFGGLVGGASLKPDDFAIICNA